MSCTACTKRYGFFCKESGCPNCGFSFCTKCLKKEIEVPRCNGTKLKVCLRCFETLEKEKKLVPKVETEATANELLNIDIAPDSLAAPLKPVHLAEDSISDEDKEIAENLDSVISKRLNKLKGTDTEKLPPDSDTASRLAALKGVPYKEYSNADILLSTDNRTDNEKAEDLVKQYVEEKVIDDQVPDPIADIERRLAALRGESSTDNKPIEQKSNNSSTSNSLKDEEEKVNKLMQRFLEEAKLLKGEEEELMEDLPPPSKDNEELPWCTICNENATVRCLGCGGDLFCKSCFCECHDDEDFKEHQTEPYQMPPNFKENYF